MILEQLSDAACDALGRSAKRTGKIGDFAAVKCAFPHLKSVNCRQGGVSAPIRLKNCANRVAMSQAQRLNKGHFGQWILRAPESRNGPRGAIRRVRGGLIRRTLKTRDSGHARTLLKSISCAK